MRTVISPPQIKVPTVVATPSVKAPVPVQRPDSVGSSPSQANLSLVFMLISICLFSVVFAKTILHPTIKTLTNAQSGRQSFEGP